MPEDSKLPVSGATRGVEAGYRRPPEDLLRGMADLLDRDGDQFERLRHALSHDLRAPIRAMRSFADLVDRRCAEGLDAKSRDFLRRIVIAGERAETLLDELVAEVRQHCLPVSPAAALPDARDAGSAEEQRRRAVILLRRLAALGPTAAAAAPGADAESDPPPRRRPEASR